MNVESFFSKTTKEALKNDPPGEWMPLLPDDCIRLSSGFPDPQLVPVEPIGEAVDRLLKDERDLPLHYLGSPAMEKLKEQIQKRSIERGMRVTEEELLITAGACQAIDLIARILIDEETVVAIESPTYMEALEVFQNYTTHFMSIPIDEGGLQTNLLEEMLAERKKAGLSMPRFLYTIPTFHNPTGTSMKEERRKHVLELAEKYNFLILEDDAYGELHFNKQSTSLKELDTQGRVLHVGSLSKVVAPGMRIGWIAAAPAFITALAWFKKDLDHPFAEATMASYLESINLEKRLETLRATYHAKCSVLLDALKQYLPTKAISWYVPEGGYFVWIKVEGVDTVDLLSDALKEGVSYVPGKFFFLDQQEGKEYLRLSFSYANQEEIVEGVKKLGKVMERILS
ncbi:PLP-dependent aminotransferase family protein [Alkalihalobacillus sp. MEB130]|uniref:aminotransferase-like domain-containing protein n=1 Tax=Alkalihalobacillus sp. MEB130 TaxID=2976704 RepID=UPI0028DFD234|nr:PLP-dependent aminotransferase family protein [Alkalihalobacillus sp. MEB130]MDT8860165.1 PLP-dependent aminotransferase family protein [Alkalihalobacillus sp. MEB130]